MKPTEFRIGNLVFNDRCLNTIENLLSDGVCTLKTKQGNFIHARYELLEGVPLTVDILSKHGITKRFNEDSCNLYDLENYKELTANGRNRGQGFICLASFEGKAGFLDLQSRTWFIYLHELQNYFFCLTGIELVGGL